jgi:TrkA-C domain
MRFMPHFRREMSTAWSGFEKVVVSAAEQTARQVEIVRLSYQIHEHEQAMEAVVERMGRFLYESQKMDANAILQHPTSQACLSELNRLQGELKFIERRRYDIREENVTTKWAEFVESVHKSGMTLESLTLPFHLKPPSMTLKELSLPQSILVIAIQRKERFIQPHGGVMLKRGDHLTILGPPQQIIQVLDRFAPGR